MCSTQLSEVSTAQHSFFLEGTLPLDFTTHDITRCKGRSGIVHAEFKLQHHPRALLVDRFCLISLENVDMYVSSGGPLDQNHRYSTFQGVFLDVSLIPLSMCTNARIGFHESTSCIRPNRRVNKPMSPCSSSKGLLQHYHQIPLHPSLRPHSYQTSLPPTLASLRDGKSAITFIFFEDGVLVDWEGLCQHGNVIDNIVGRTGRAVAIERRVARIILSRWKWGPAPRRKLLEVFLRC